MAETPRLDLPYLAASQAQKELMHNVSLDRLDLLVQCVVLDRNLNTPPASPALGDAYIVGPSPTGVWVGHANALALYVNLQWQFIAPLPGFQCWVLDEAVQVGWSGSAWTITASGGAGATTLLALSDTPDSYGGQAGKTLLVNPGETALVFGTVAGSAPVDATYIVSSSNTTLTAERVVTDNTQIVWDTATAGQLKAALAAHGVALDRLPQLPAGTLLGRSDTLAPVDDVQVITVGAGLALAGTTLTATGGGGGSSDFLGLSDTPDSYSGQAGKVVLVNAGATALEFGTPAAGATTFLALTDSPDSYVGQAGKGVTVNGAATGLEFTTAVTGSYDLGLTWAGTLPASQVLLRYPFPRAVDFPAGLTGSRGVAAVAATATTTLDLRKNGTSVGSVQYAAGATTATLTMASATSFAAGDVLTVHAPASVDATLADIGLSLAGTRAVAAGEMGATTWLGLTDTPNAYTGQGSNLVTVNSGATALDYTPLTAAGRALLDDADAAAQRTTLGLGTMATQNADAVAITGGTLLLPHAELTVGIRLGDATPPGVQLDVAGNGRLTGWLAATTGLRLGDVTAPQGNTRLHITHPKGSIAGAIFSPSDADNGAFAELIFTNLAGGTVGSIASNGTGTAFNTSSDVRLKASIHPLVGALGVVQALRPVSFRWQVDDSPGIGFLAHELMRVVPEAVTGEPDAVGAQGEMLPQQVDQSRLVPWLTAACQELLAQVATLSARVSNLETQLGL